MAHRLECLVITEVTILLMIQCNARATKRNMKEKSSTKVYQLTAKQQHCYLY